MQNDPISLFVAKLERRHPLPDRERSALLELPCERRDYPPGVKVVVREQSATHCVLIGGGMVSRQKTLPDGNRQILAVHLPGDAVDLQAMFFKRADHDIGAHAQVQVGRVAYTHIFDLCEDYPLLAKALWLDCLVDASIFREWTANIGQRDAKARIAHLFAEMAARHEAIGVLRKDGFDLPLNQQDIADALGLSLVHTNKSLRALREANLLHIDGRHVSLLDRSGLEALAMFDRQYLHLDGARMADPMASATREAVSMPADPPAAIARL